MAERGATECDKERILSKEKYENRKACSRNTVGELATSSEETERDGVAGEPIEGNPEDTAALAHTWIHGAKPIGYLQRGQM